MASLSVGDASGVAGAGVLASETCGVGTADFAGQPHDNDAAARKTQAGARIDLAISAQVYSVYL
jgi:hypothetical protein